LSTAGRHCCRVPWKKGSPVAFTCTTHATRQTTAVTEMIFKEYSNEADPMIFRKIFFEKCPKTELKIIIKAAFQWNLNIGF